MTDRIDLDDVETDGEETPDGNHGDWLWRGEGDPNAEPGAPDAGVPGADSSAGDDPEGEPVPRVPREDEDRPAGVPADRGGAGAGATAGSGGPGEGARTVAEGPHGGGVDDVTVALTYEAVSRLADPQLVVASAREWADWVGIVGDVSAPVINKFQREHGVDADFFNGTGTEPAERLADIEETSMFYAERLVVVGAPGEEWMAEQAGWEFVPLPEAAEKADWTLDRRASGPGDGDGG